MYYAKHTVEKLRQASEIVIYGARIVAKEVAYCLMEKPYQLRITGFMVSALEGNPSELLGLPVITLAEGKRNHPNALVVIAVLERYLDEITAELRKAGFKDILPMTFESDLWSQIRGNSYRFYCQSSGKPYLTLEEELSRQRDRGRTSDVKVYRVQSHADKPLHTSLDAFSWEIPIQAGAALTDLRIADIRDDQGENISRKNRQYCELTALYWIWKQGRSRYAGLCHYRRHFNLNQEWLEKIPVSNIDVVLTIPILNTPDVRTVYANDHIADDWNVMLEAIRTLQPAYIAAVEQLQAGKYYYGYNMFLAKKEILDDYCSWLFPILACCEKRCGEKKDGYQNRYIGFLGERLLSVYFLHNESRYKIVHAQKTFLMG